jgi:protein required for attachment to host cells
MSICVVVADSGKARLLVAETGDSPLVDERDFVHPESRLKEQELVSDGPGSERDTAGAGRHSVGGEKDTHKRHAEIFAGELCTEIDRLRQDSDLRRIYLVAAPKFLGLLRAALSQQCQDLLAGEINKDLVSHSIEDIRSHLPRRL